MNKVARRQKLLVDHYLDFYAVASAMLLDDDDARDAVQEAVVRTLSQPFVHDPVAYCHQTLRHVAIDIIRHNMKTVVAHGEEPSFDPERENFYLKLREAYEELPDDSRALMNMHDIEGYTYDELASMLSVSKSTIRRLVKKAHNTMKNKLKDEI